MRALGLLGMLAITGNADHATARVVKFEGGTDKRWKVTVVDGKNKGDDLSAKGLNLVIVA